MDCGSHTIGAGCGAVSLNWVPATGLLKSPSGIRGSVEGSDDKGSVEGSEDYSGFAIASTRVVECVTCSTHALTKPLPRGVGGREGPGALDDEHYNIEAQSNDIKNDEHCDIKTQITQEA